MNRPVIIYLAAVSVFWMLVSFGLQIRIEHLEALNARCLEQLLPADPLPPGAFEELAP